MRNVKHSFGINWCFSIVIMLTLDARRSTAPATANQPTSNSSENGIIIKKIASALHKLMCGACPKLDIHLLRRICCCCCSIIWRSNIFRNYHTLNWIVSTNEIDCYIYTHIFNYVLNVLYAEGGQFGQFKIAAQLTILPLISIIASEHINIHHYNNNSD